MKNTESKQILEYLKRIDASINGAEPKKKPATAGRPLSEQVNGLDKKIGDLDARVTGLDAKVTGLDNRVSEVQLGLATLGVSQKAGFDRAEQRLNEVDRQFKKVDTRFDVIDVKFKQVDKRFDEVDQKIESARAEIVALVDCVYDEVTGRVIDLEKVGPGRKGNGGRGSGGGGVPLAS